MRPIYFVDFEASGIAPDSYPIEIAVVSADSQYQALIRPVHYWEHWSHDAQDMHGISRKDLLELGTDTHALALELNRLLPGAEVCSDSPQDVFWLDTLYEAAGIEPGFTIRPLEAFMSREEAGEVVRLMSTKKAHRALPDALDLKNAVETYFLGHSKNIFS